MGSRPLTLMVGLAVAGSLVLTAQTYSSIPGKTSTFGLYDPLDNGPLPKAPALVLAPFTQPFLPVLPADQYDALKAQISKYSQSSFALPAQVEISSPGPGPRAPAAGPGAASQPPVAATPTISWEGIPNTQFQPPSPDIAVGPSDVLMVVNSSIAQFTKAGAMKKITTFQNWFGALTSTVCLTGPSDCLIFDPWLAYDQLHGRFLFLASATAAIQQNRTHSFLLLSVSNGATYDSGWKIWVLDSSLDGNVMTTNWGDSWRLGLDSQAIYLSGNQYNASGQFQYAKIRVLKKSDVYNSAATTLPWKDILNLKNEDGSFADSLMPAHQRGKPTAVASGYYVNASHFTLPASYLTVWKLGDPLADTVTATRSTVGGLLAYNLPAPAPQLGGPATLDTADARVLKAIYRSGFLYVARNTGYNDQATTTTYDVIDTSTMKIASQARLINTNSFYPAFDVPASTPSGSQFASVNLVTGTTTAADGTLTHPGLSKLKAGEDYFSVNFGGLSRWGDYFGGSLDPVTGGLWVSGEYAKVASFGFGQWGTWVGYYPWLTSQAFTDVPATSFYADYINVLGSWQIALGCSAAPALFCPTSEVSRGQMAAFLIRAMYGDNNFTYPAAPFFTDVPATDSFYPYIQKLRELGIVHGCSPTTYCPNNAVIRLDVAVMIIRAKLESLFGDNFTFPATAVFTDVPPATAQFPFVQKMAELGITSGCTPTLYCPNSNVTRQEVAVFLTRALLN